MLTRKLILFVLGCAVILDAIIQTPTHVTELICGLFLVGLVSLDDFLGRLPLTRIPRGPSATPPS